MAICLRNSARRAMCLNTVSYTHLDVYKRQLEAKLADVLAAAEARAEQINALESVTIASKAGDEGKLFGSIGTRDIADAVTAAGVKVAKSEVRLPNGVLRNVGEHEVNFQVHSEVFAKVIINVVAE